MMFNARMLQIYPSEQSPMSAGCGPVEFKYIVFHDLAGLASCDPELLP
jgi:hypothetical protein